MTDKPTGAGYSKTHVGEIGTDGVHRDWNGNVVASGLDEDTKAELLSMLEGPKVRVLPSDNDILNGNFTGGVDNPVYINPNDSADAAAQVYRPGYAVESAEDDGKTAEQKSVEAAEQEKTDAKGETVITAAQPQETDKSEKTKKS